MAWPAPGSVAGTQTGALSQGWRTETGPAAKGTTKRSERGVAPKLHGHRAAPSGRDAESSRGRDRPAAEAGGLLPERVPQDHPPAYGRRARWGHRARHGKQQPPAHGSRTVGRGVLSVPSHPERRRWFHSRSPASRCAMTARPAQRSEQAAASSQQQADRGAKRSGRPPNRTRWTTTTDRCQRRARRR